MDGNDEGKQCRFRSSEDPGRLPLIQNQEPPLIDYTRGVPAAMDTVLNLLFRLIGLLAPTALLGGIGWLSLKVITLGRYPKRAHKAEHWHDFDALAFVGAAEIMLLVCVVGWIRGGS